MSILWQYYPIPSSPNSVILVVKLTKKSLKDSASKYTQAKARKEPKVSKVFWSQSLKQVLAHVNLKSFERDT